MYYRNTPSRSERRTRSRHHILEHTLCRCRSVAAVRNRSWEGALHFAYMGRNGSGREKVDILYAHDIEGRTTWWENVLFIKTTFLFKVLQLHTQIHTNLHDEKKNLR